MSADDLLAGYMSEFEAQLAVRGLRRRRIVTEVRTHVYEAVADLERDRPTDRAAREAIARFGSAQEIAAQFNSSPQSTRLVARRLVVLWAAWLAAMAMGSATVWAAVQGGGAEGISRPAAHVRHASSPSADARRIRFGRGASRSRTRLR